MARMTRYGYTPETKDVSAQGTYTPDSNVSGKRFEPDGTGGGILYVRKTVHRAGFRPVEAWVKIRKQPMVRA